MADEAPRPTDAPTPEQYEAEARERAEQLAKTIEVYHRYDWGTDLLTVDPDDLIVDRPETEAHGEFAPHPRLMKQDFERFVDEAYVGRVLERAEAVLENELALDLRGEVSDTLDFVENLAVPPHVVGFHVGVLADAARRAKEERRRRDAAATVTDEARAAVEALVGDADADLGALETLGGDAWPALEAIAAEDPSGPGALAALRGAAGRGGPRAIRLAVDALTRDADSTGDAVLEVLTGFGAEAGWAALGRLHFEGLTPEARRVLLAVALESDEPLAVTLVIHEAIQAFQGEIEGVGSEHGVRLSRMLVERGDTRAVPLLAFVLKSEEFGKEAHDLLVDTLQGHGMWGEVSRVLASLKGNWPLIVPAGNTFESFAARIAELEGVDVKDEEARDAFVAKAQEHWQDCYREELGYQRTRDADRPGPVEMKLMAQFTAEASHLAQGAPDQTRMQARIENYREQWMRTPLRTLDGRRPLAVIFEERIGLQSEGIARDRARRTILARTMQDVKALVTAGRMKRARAAMGVLDEVAPDYPPAQRLRKSLA